MTFIFDTLSTTFMVIVNEIVIRFFSIRELTTNKDVIMTQMIFSCPTILLMLTTSTSLAYMFVTIWFQFLLCSHKLTIIHHTSFSPNSIGGYLLE